MILDREHVIKVFDEYTSDYDITDVKVKLKVDHTYRVAELADTIAKSLNLPGEDIDLAWLLGMLHDIGRFEQLRRYNTFIDSVSVNHAALSADILFLSKDGNKAPGMIREFIDDSSEDDIIQKAIRLHNVFILPESLTERELLFCNILRDADKIDILKVNCDIPREDIYDKPFEEIKKESISPKVYEDAVSLRNVDRRNVVTVVDSHITQICFVYGLVFAESFRQVLQQGYLKKLLEFESDNPETLRQLGEIGQTVMDYMEKAINNMNGCKVND